MNPTDKVADSGGLIGTFFLAGNITILDQLKCRHNLILIEAKSVKVCHSTCCYPSTKDCCVD